MKEIYLDRHCKDCQKDYKCEPRGFVFFLSGKYFIVHYNSCFVYNLRMRKNNLYYVNWDGYDEVVMIISHIIDRYKICEVKKISRGIRADIALEKFRKHGVKFKRYITHVNVLYGTGLQWAITTQTPFIEGILPLKDYYKEYCEAESYLKNNDLQHLLPQIKGLHAANCQFVVDEMEAVKTLEALRVSILHTIKNQQ